MARVRTVYGCWYDHPRYYDLAMHGETRREADFIEAACAQHLRTSGRRSGQGRRLRLLEPACGTGRLTVELARRGHRVSGFDLNAKAVAYARRRVRRRGVEAEIFAADMADFRVRGKFDAAYNLVSSLRHLTTHAEAASHLASVARSLRIGGLYLLGLILVPEDSTEEEAFERWTARRGATRVTATLTVPEMNLAERWEIQRTTLTARGPRETVRIVTEERMGIYTPADMRRLIEASPEFELVGTYDFWYEVDRLEAFDDRYGDVVFVLRRVRRGGRTSRGRASKGGGRL
jgi:SAM-dependent methyltransferase